LDRIDYTTILMMCGIIPSGEFLAVVGGKVRHAYSSTLSFMADKRNILGQQDNKNHCLLT